MAIYQNSTANLGVKLEITHASPDIANNRTTITYKASVYKIGSHNPFNNYSQTPMYLTINGQSLYSTATGNYNLRGGTYEQVIKSGTLVIPHNSDGTKSFSFSWNVNFTSTGYGYGNVTASGTYTLPTIARASTFTIPSTTITTGSAFTVTINKASDGFRHKVAYIVGSSVNEWITNADTTYSATIPHSLFNSHKSADSVSGVIRVTTMNGSVEVGSNQRTVTINLTASATPTLASVSYTNSNKGMFTGTNQFIRNVSLPTIIAGTATGSYSSTISSYEFQTLRGSTVLETISKTANSQQFGAFNFPNSGSEANVYMQARVRDSRGRYSGWVKTPQLRVHHYAPPAIGTMTVRRAGSGNTILQVTRNYVVTSMFESGGTTNSNTASLSFQHRTKGTTSATNNTGAKSTTMFLTNSNANLAGTFAANTSYEVRAILTDALNTVYGSWIGVGTEFVPMDIGPKGIGVGKVHSDGSADLEVGAGGISNEGPSALNGIITSRHGDVTTERNMGSMYSPSESNNGVIIIKLPNRNVMFDGKITLRSYGYAAEIFVGGYTYTGSSAWYLPQAFGTVDGNNVNVRFSSDGANRYILVGDTGTIWGGYLHVSVDNIHTGFGESFNNRCTVSLGSSYVGTINKIFTIYNQRRGHGSGLDADLLDGKHASAFVDFSNGDEINGKWFKVGGMIVCIMRFVLNDFYSSYTLSKRWTYPTAFTQTPTVILTGRTNIGHMEVTNGAELNGTLQTYAETNTYCDIAWFRQGGSAYVSGDSKYINAIAIGV